MEEGKKNRERSLFSPESFIHTALVVNSTKLHFTALDERKFYKIPLFTLQYYFSASAYALVSRRNRKKLKENEAVFVGHATLKNIVT